MTEAARLDELVQLTLAAYEFLGMVDMGGEASAMTLAQMPGSQWVPTNPVAFLGEGMEDLTKLK